MSEVELLAMNFPHVIRAGELLASIMLFIMTTSSLNYDLFFFTPAFRAFDMSHKTKPQVDKLRTMMTFLTANFTIEEYASDFEFSSTETADKFFLRFLQYLDSKDNVPQDVNDAIVALESYSDEYVHPFLTKGFIKPCPTYILARIMTFLTEFDYALKPMTQYNLTDSVDVIFKFLTEDFMPSVHGKGLVLNNNADIYDIVTASGFGFEVANDKTKRLKLMN
ncbi:hypothetical protein L9F63_011020, partial [Diploptera punctata]